MKPNRRRVVIVPGVEALAKSAAERLLARVAHVEDRAAICLTGGTSPEGLYKRLAQDPYRGALPWDRIHWFIGDERFVPADDKRNNMGVARRLLLDHVGVPAGNIHPIATDATSPDAAARLYEAGQDCGEQANMAKQLAAEASWAAADMCVQTHGGFGFAEEYDIERKFRETRLYTVAPISTNLVLSYLAEHVLGLPRSY